MSCRGRQWLRHLASACSDCKLIILAPLLQCRRWATSRSHVNRIGGAQEDISSGKPNWTRARSAWPATTEATTGVIFVYEKQQQPMTSSSCVAPRGNLLLAGGFVACVTQICYKLAFRWTFVALIGWERCAYCGGDGAVKVALPQVIGKFLGIIQMDLIIGGIWSMDPHYGH